MTTGTKVILSIILFGGLGTIVFLKIQQGKKDNKDAKVPAGDTGNSTSAPVSNPATPKASITAGSVTNPLADILGTGTKTVAPDARIGKTANAKFDGTAVYNKDGSLYKTAKQGEWIGKVSSVSNGKIFVEGDIRYVFDTTVPSVTTNFSGKSKK